MNDEGSGEAKDGQRLVLQQWEIWHTFSSFLSGAPPAPEDMARNLVEFGIAECAVTSDGLAWWSADDPKIAPRRAGYRDNELGHGAVEIRLGQNNRAAKIVLPPTPSGYSQEALYQFATLRSAELRLLGVGPLPPRYVRAFVGACAFRDEGETPRYLMVYPQIKIFETGVILVEFRMLSPARHVGVGEFIDEYVNATLTEFEFLGVPPGVLAWSADELSPDQKPRWYQRPRIAYLRRQHQQAIPEYCASVEAGDFVFQQTPMGIASDMEALHGLLMQELQALKLDRVDNGRKTEQDALVGVDKESVRMKDRALPTGRRGKSKKRALRRAKKKAKAKGSKQVREVPPLEKGQLHSGSKVQVQDLSDDAIYNDAVEAAFLALQTRERTPETFLSLALTIMRATSVVAGARTNGPRGDFSLAVFGPGRTNDIGSHWRGRPNVHLVRFSEQAEHASANEARFGDDLGAIVIRTDEPASKAGLRLLPKSTRVFDDYGEYLGESCALWVHSLGSIARQGKAGWVDSNRGHLVYENQVKAELLEYGYALHRRIAEQALNASIETSRLLAVQRDLADFEWAVQDTGRFGEVRELLERGWKAFGVGQLRTRIAQVLHVRHDEAVHRESVASRRWTALLAVVAGILTVPPVAEAVLAPLWNWRGWPLPANAYAAKLMLVGVSVLGVLLIGLSGYWWASRARRRSLRARTYDGGSGL